MHNPHSVSALSAATTRHPIVLYSCLYGKREAYNPDTFGPNRGAFPCLVFSDDPELPVPEGVRLVHDPLNGLDPGRASRRAKLMPERYLPPCEWSVYLDNKRRMTVAADRLIDHLKTLDGHALFASSHQQRTCLYDEGSVCIQQKKDAAEVIIAQLQHYETLGFPRNAGLIHAAFMVRRHDSDQLRTFGERWFEHVLRYSRRDQISFPFVAREVGIKTYYGDPVFDSAHLLEPSPHRPSGKVQRPAEGHLQPSRAATGAQTPRAGKRSFWDIYVKPYLS